MTTVQKPPLATASMMIRRPVAEVFQAFIDPAITARFWFTKGSARLQAGASVRWHWEMYGVFADVAVKEVSQNERIVIEWPQGDYHTQVEWRFTARGEGETFVEITNCGFRGESIVDDALDATGGFHIVLCGAKAWLEHGIRLRLVEDKFPDGLVEGWGEGGK